jgi:polyisoprenoid-binding protein YceI
MPTADVSSSPGLSLAVGETLDSVAVDALIELASVDTNNPDRGAHLLSTDFFAAEKNPRIRFTSKGITGTKVNVELELQFVTD